MLSVIIVSKVGSISVSISSTVVLASTSYPYSTVVIISAVISPKIPSSVEQAASVGARLGMSDGIELGATEDSMVGPEVGDLDGRKEGNDEGESVSVSKLKCSGKEAVIGVKASHRSIPDGDSVGTSVGVVVMIFISGDSTSFSHGLES